MSKTKTKKAVSAKAGKKSFSVERSPLLMIALGVAVVSGYLVYWNNIHPTPATVHAAQGSTTTIQQ